MIPNARYVHTNLVAHDWRKLARFYEDVFGCRPIPPERELAGQWLDDATGIPDAEIRGVHLRLPGYVDDGPTLEIFQYNDEAERPATAPNRPGFGHIAFAVDDVNAARDAVIAAGGGTVGDIVSVEIAGAGTITFMYATDPEGNIIELQEWVTAHTDFTSVPDGSQDITRAEYRITVSESPDPIDRQYLEDRIKDFNNDISEYHRVVHETGTQPLAIFIRDVRDRIMGGLTADIYWGWIFIDDLWIHESLRGRGYGSRLLAQAEAEAQSRGCTRVWLRTFSFQARGFYEKYGYRVVGQLDDYPPGETFCWMRKDFPTHSVGRSGEESILF